MKKRLLFAAIFVFLCGFSAACQGYREIDGEYLISAIGFEEKDENFTVCAEVLEMGADKGNTVSRLFKGEGKTPYAAVENIMTALPKRAVFDHCGTAIIGSKTGKKAFKTIVSYLYDAKNLNLAICLYCAEDTQEILSAASQGISVGYDIMLIKNNIEKATGIPFKNKYYEVVGLSMSKGVFVLPEVSLIKGHAKIGAQKVYAGFSPVFSLYESDIPFFNLLAFGSRGGEIAAGGKRCRFNGIKAGVSRGNGAAELKISVEYRSEKHRATAEIKAETEKLLARLYGNPARKLVCPGVGDKERVEVAIIER